jgi:(2Fe-2S) ferredoxin
MMDDQKQFRLYLCHGSQCTMRGSPALFRHMEQAVADRNLGAVVDVRAGGCQDHCDHGPNMLIWPGPVRYAHLTPPALLEILVRHIVGGEPVRELLATPAMRR